MIKKKSKFTIFPLLIGFFFYGFTAKHNIQLLKERYSTKDLSLFYDVPTADEIDSEAFLLAPRVGKNYLGFKEALGFKESGGRYSVVNRFGYIGKYQFGKNTLRMIGIKDARAFLRSPELQEEAFYANSSRNKWILRKFIAYFDGMKIKGIQITESGILAAAHLVGPGAVKVFLRSGGQKVPSDAFGTSIVDYMRKFSGYDTSFIFPERKAKAFSTM